VSLFADIPRETTYAFKKGMAPHLGAYAIQRALNVIYPDDSPLITDGSFGDASDARVKKYQTSLKLVSDGIAGPVTQRRIALSMRKHADPEERVPRGIIDGLVMGESGGYVDAKNWSVNGGVDLSYVQRRVAYPVQSATAVERAYNPPYQFGLVVDNILEDQARYLAYPYVATRADHWEYAWRLAVLEHNWPYGSQQLARGQKLSSQPATWVPPGTRFDDGAAVATFADWAKFYAMGSHVHSHAGFMVKPAFGIPADG
jgi:Putative peptidoglycan binding domain